MPKISNKPKEEAKISPFEKAIQNIRTSASIEKKEEGENEIADIISFCNDPRYLALPDNHLTLWTSQKVILKCFYMGSVGNETLSLNQEEWEWLYSNEESEDHEGVVYKKNIKDVIRKMLARSRDDKMPYFKELHLVLGRRSSKTLIASVITTYEAYKLLVINKGDPHGFYNLPNDDEIAIINVATSQQQAGRLFGQIQARIRNSPFFKDRVAKETTTEIRLLTNRDMEKVRSGSTLSVSGSILLLCGHSNPDSLAGYSAIMILFDEIAFYDETGKVTGKYFYGRLKPSLAKFYKYNAARIVQISSPNNRMGIFYETARLSERDDDTGNSILSFQLPTWCVNPDIPYDNQEMARDRETNLDLFTIEFGAQWAETGTYHGYFAEGQIDRCIRGDIGPHKGPQPYFSYYLHVDPAKKTANYAAVLVAKQRYTNNMGQKRNRCYLAGTWVWRPQPGVGLLFNEIDKDIIRICNVFHPQTVTYDDYHSMHSLQLLRSHGINTRQLSYNRSVKLKVYQNLRDLMSYLPEPELFLYDNGGESSLLIVELRNLKQKQTQRGMTIMPDKNADVKNDDLCVHPDTIVFSDRPKAIKDIKIGDEILTHTGVYRTVIDKKEHCSFKKILKLYPHYGLPLIATDNHPVEVYNINDSSRSWKAVRDLTQNDMVVRSFETKKESFSIDLEKYVNNNLHGQGSTNNYLKDDIVRDKNSNAKWHNRKIESNYSFGYICGLYLSEGSMADHGVSIAANINETNIHEKFKRSVKDVFGFYDTGHKRVKDQNGSQTHINSQIVKRLFLDMFDGKTAGNKFIPRIMMTANLEFQKGLINGLWDGDGCYCKNKKSFAYTTTSRVLAAQLSSLLLSFGIVSNINHIKRKGRVTTIKNRELRFNYDLYNVFVGDASSFNLLSDILDEYKKIHKVQSKYHNPKFILGDGFVAYKVRKIEESSLETVVNVTVDGDHSYVSEYINSHNCDCLAGACSSACEGLRMGLPEPVVVRTGWA